MFDLEDKLTTKVTKGDTPVDRLPTTEGMEPDEEVGNPLDSAQTLETHSKMLSYYRQELERQSENRQQQATDEDYYDHIQWSEEDAQELKARGQAPISYNVIAQTLNWIIGSEKRGRTDFKILPRGKEDAKPAESKTKFMKYLSDVNRTVFHRSRAFEDTAKVGIGWLEDGAQDEDDGEQLYTRYENWRNMLWDSASTEIDGSDMRYLFRSKWVDVDIAIALFPERRAEIERSVTDSVSFGSAGLMDGDDAMDSAEAERENSTGVHGAVTMHRRRRVRLIEGWYRMPMQVKRIRGGAFSGQAFEESDPRHVDDVETGRAVLVDKVMMRTRVCIMTPTAMLYDDVSPYRHNRFPFTPIWAYRRGRDGLPYGVIRGLRDIQDDINKRASKALHILSTNKTNMEEGVLPDGMTVEDFADENARPDAINVFQKGALSSGRVQFGVDRELAPAHLDLMSRNINMIQQVGGVTDELLGRTTNAVSGIAVEKRQEQGSISTNKLFDNLRLGVQMQGELQLANMEQFVTEEKQFRITNQRGTPEFLTVNDGLPENDITRTKADFVISEADWRATMRQAATAQLTEMMTKMPPQVALVMLDLVVESMDIENRDEIVKRIRQVNAMRDPDATELTEEEIAGQQAQAKQQQLQDEMMTLEIRERAAKAALSEIQAKRVEAQIVGDGVTAAKTAMEAATAIITQPTIATVADNLLMEAGWNGQGGGAPIAAQGLPPAAAQQPPAPPPPPQSEMAPPMEPQPQGAPQ